MTECITRRCDPLIPLEECRKRAEFSNPRRVEVEVGKVDGCLISDERSRCDWYVRNEDLIWLVELKGKDILKAIDQIVQTSHHLSKDIGNRKIVPVIVTSHCPAIAMKQKQLIGLNKCRGKISHIVLRTRIAKITV